MSLTIHINIDSFIVTPIFASHHSIIQIDLQPEKHLSSCISATQHSKKISRTFYGLVIMQRHFTNSNLNICSLIGHHVLKVKLVFRTAMSVMLVKIKYHVLFRVPTLLCNDYVS